MHEVGEKRYLRGAEEILGQDVDDGMREVELLSL